MVRKTKFSTANTTIFKLVSNADNSVKIFSIRSSKNANLFEELLKKTKDEKIYWIDDEGDRIPIETANDLKEAIRYLGRVVKIYEGENKKQSETSKEVNENGNDERDIVILTDESITSESSESSESSDSEDSSSDDDSENSGPRRRRNHSRNGGRHGKNRELLGRRHGGHGGRHGDDHGRRGKFDRLVDFPGRHGGHHGHHHDFRGGIRGPPGFHFGRQFGGHHGRHSGHFEHFRKHHHIRGGPQMPPNFYFDRSFDRHHGHDFPSHHHWPSFLNDSSLMRRHPGQHPCHIRIPRRFGFCRDDRRGTSFPQRGQHHHNRQRTYSC